MTTRTPDYFLSSSEGYGLESPRACYVQRALAGRANDVYVLVMIDPPLPGQKYDRGDDDIRELVLATRHQGQSIYPVSEWPLYVHVAIPIEDIDATRSEIATEDLQLVGWGEIYRTRDDATQ